MRILPILLGLATLLAGCASPTNDDATLPTTLTPTSTPSPSPASRSPTSAPNLVHSVQDGVSNVFDPASLSVAVGTTVTWDVVGEGHHTVDFLSAVAATGGIPKSGDIGPGDTFEVIFPEPGAYKYYCKYHSNKQSGMVGTIIVE
jgi:plastocyanin